MWTYEGNIFSVVPENIIGFVYLITNTLTTRQYIGKKLFTFSRIRRVKGKKKRFKIESDWREYYGSNKELLNDITSLGKEHFNREILYLCSTKGQCSYYETYEIFNRRALLTEDFYNAWVTCKISKTHLKL